MSTLTDLFTSLANKIRSKLGTTSKYTPAQAISAIDDVYTKGVTDTKVGTAIAADVRSDKTFTNSSSVGINGSMPVNPDTVNPTAVGVDVNSPYAYFPYGYHPIHQGGSGALLRISQAQANSLARPIHTGGTAWVTLSGINATAPFVYIPYGWYPQENTTYGTYVYMTTAQAQALHAHTGTYTFSSGNGSTIDLGVTHSYRYVNAQVVYANGKKAIGTNNQYTIVSADATGTTYYYSVQYGAGYANTFCFTILSNSAGSFVSGDAIKIYDTNGATLRTYDLTTLPGLNREVGMLSPTGKANIYSASITLHTKQVGFYFRWLFG